MAVFGDLMCALIPVNYILNNCPWINLLVWVPDYLKDFAQHVLPNNTVIRNYTEAKTKYDNTRTGITTQWKGQHTPMRTHPVQYAYHVLCDYTPNVEQQTYLKIRSKEINLDKFNLPKKYVVIQGAFTEKVKTMPVDTFNNLTDFVIQKGYIPIYVGKTESLSGIIEIKTNVVSNYDFLKGIDLVNKTSVLETVALIAESKLLICMDGGILHMAGFTDTTIVCGFTFAKPEQLMPIRDGIQGKNIYSIVPDESLGCKFCQSNLTLLYEHDFRTCLYKDFKCQEQITFNKFKEIIEQNNLL